MEDRKASVIAAMGGCLAVAGFWTVRPHGPTARLRLIDQWVPTSRSGPDGDAAVMFLVDIRGTAGSEEPLITYEVADSSGTSYPLVPSATPGAIGILKLARGYGRALSSPRLLARLGSHRLGSVSLGPLPSPERHPLVRTNAPPVSLVLRGGAGLFAEPVRSIAPNERWRVVARGTPFVAGLESAATVAPYQGRFNRRLDVPFADEAGLVEVDLTRYRLQPESEVVRIEGCRLERRFGGAAVVVERAVRVPDRLGATILLPAQNSGPRRPSRTPRLIAGVNLSALPRWFDALPPELQRGRGPILEILAPKPESLGLRELRIGPGTCSAAEPPTAPLRKGPFSATVRLTFYRPVPIETRRLVVPVTFGPAIGGPILIGGPPVFVGSPGRS